MTEDVFALASEEAEQSLVISDDALEAVAQLANRQQRLEDEITFIENNLAMKKKELQRVQEHDIPEAMDRVGLEEFKLVGGGKVKVSTFYTASISAERKPAAISWLDDHGHGGLVKTAVSLEFGKGELDKAKEFLDWLNEQRPDVDPELDQSVHWQTLRAFVREQIESGAALPQELFGVFIGRKAKITRPKEK